MYAWYLEIKSKPVVNKQGMSLVLKPKVQGKVVSVETGNTQNRIE